MRLPLRTRQMVTVVALVVTSVSALAVVNLLTVVRIRFEESTAQAELLARTVFRRAQQIVPSAADPRRALGDDSGIRAILERGLFLPNVRPRSAAEGRRSFRPALPSRRAPRIDRLFSNNPPPGLAQYDQSRESEPKK